MATGDPYCSEHGFIPCICKFGTPVSLYPPSDEPSFAPGKGPNVGAVMIDAMAHQEITQLKGDLEATKAMCSKLAGLVNDLTMRLEDKATFESHILGALMFNMYVEMGTWIILASGRATEAGITDKEDVRRYGLLQATHQLEDLVKRMIGKIGQEEPVIESSVLKMLQQNIDSFVKTLKDPPPTDLPGRYKDLLTTPENSVK